MLNQPQFKRCNQDPVSFQPSGPWKNHSPNWSMENDRCNIDRTNSKNFTPLKVTTDDIRALPDIYRSFAEYLIRAGYPGLKIVENDSD